ncbi:hypothetical protein BKA58DRAFT_125994 [Alternaria rosae]|uniref:uncharacterized protein n=1 Tax=Alternaria rosae TaxID=1187941 RepID=UPI001E8E204D|nr:uncharacterized protein BKA58DRAFT_125994 [Alternaria rosae]KAH6875668.1 hypothetical protein BKA58DRAFT_125994 [Alternaria rosae]
MSYPPNSPEIVRRHPQHGIRAAGGIATSSPHSHSSSSMDVHTIICAEDDCNNKLDVLPHGHYAGLVGKDSVIYIKARCKECEPPVTVASWWEGYKESEEGSDGWKEEPSDWADEF